MGFQDWVAHIPDEHLDKILALGQRNTRSLHHTGASQFLKSPPAAAGTWCRWRACGRVVTWMRYLVAMTNTGLQKLCSGPLTSEGSRKYTEEKGNALAVSVPSSHTTRNTSVFSKVASLLVAAEETMHMGMHRGLRRHRKGLLIGLGLL